MAARRNNHESANLRKELEVAAFLLDSEAQNITKHVPGLMADYPAQSAAGGDPVATGEFLFSLAQFLRQVAKRIE